MKGRVTILKSIWGRFITTTFPLFFLILQTTCITPLDVRPSDFENLLVVQGFITDDFGPHDIRISRLTQFSGVRDGGEITIEDAEVQIFDDNGVSIPLERASIERKELINISPPRCVVVRSFVKSRSDYRTPETFKGEVGRTYTLQINTRDGQTYFSEPQTISPTPSIDSISFKYKELPSLDPIIPRSGVEIFATWQDPSEKGFYFWRINGIYRIHTPDRSSPGVLCCLYDPRDGGEDNCWINEVNIVGNELAFSDQMVNGQNITIKVGFIEDDGLRFANRQIAPQRQYYVEVEQFSIPQSAFEFTNRIKTLGEINGEIFDSPPLSVRGNLFNAENAEEVVIGYFGAYSVQKRNQFIPRSLLTTIKRWPEPCGDCRTRGGAQTETPEPYKN